MWYLEQKKQPKYDGYYFPIILESLWLFQNVVILLDYINLANAKLSVMVIVFLQSSGR